MIIFPDSAVADFAVAAGQPGDEPFDHRSMLAVDLLERLGFGLPTGGAEQRVVLMHSHRPTGEAGGALGPQLATLG